MLAVFRTEALLNFVSTSLANKFLFNELLWSCGAVLTPKIRRMPEVFAWKTEDMYLTGHPLYLFPSHHKTLLSNKEYRKRLLKIINYTENHEPVDKRTVDHCIQVFSYFFDLAHKFSQIKLYKP